MADEQIVGHRNIGEQVDLLIDGANPQALGVGRVRGGYQGAIQLDATRITLINPGEGFYQGGFARND